MPIKVITEIDEFFRIIKEKEEITIEEISYLMEVEIDLAERWASALNRAGFISLHYPTFSPSKGKVRVRFVDDPPQNHYGRSAVLE